MMDDDKRAVVNYCNMSESQLPEGLQATARKRIELAMQVTGWSATRLAREAGVSTTTITRFLHFPVKHTVSLTTLAKVDAAVESFISRIPDSIEKIKASLAYQSAAIQAHQEPLEPISNGMISVKVSGFVQAGYFTDALEIPEWEQQTIILPRPDNHAKHFGLRVRGDSMNQVFPEGTILVCVPIQLYDFELQNGDYVIVERFQNDLVEATVKEIRQDGDKNVWLWPRSDNPQHQAPIKLPRNGDAPDSGDDEIRVVAVVVADYRIRARQ